MNILISVLAINYITLLVTEYDGPFEVFEWLRNVSREYRGLNLDCFFCTALWVSIPFALLLSNGWMSLVYMFGLAGGAAIINEVLGND
jgi:hypothetical protein